MRLLWERFRPKFCGAKCSESTRRRVTYSTVGFLFIFSTIGDLAYYSLLKDKMGLQPAELVVCNVFGQLLFLLKPLYGFMTDNFYLCGRRRQPYIVLCGVIATGLWVVMSLYTDSLLVSVVIMILIGGMIGIINAVSQALVVEDSQEKKTADAQNSSNPSAGLYNNNKAVNNISLYSMAKSLGLLASSYLSGLLVTAFSIPTVFLITASVPAMIALSGTMLCEKPKADQKDDTTSKEEMCAVSNNTNESLYAASDRPEIISDDSTPKRGSSFRSADAKTLQDPGWRYQARRIFCFLRMKTIMQPIVFMFVLAAMPGTGETKTYFYLDEMKFDYEFLGRIRFAESAALMFGVAIYQRWLKGYSFKQLVVLGTVLMAVFDLSQLLQIYRCNVAGGMPDEYFSLGQSFFSALLSQVQVMPILVLTCKLCPERLEAVIYATIMGIRNIAVMISYGLGGVLTYVLGIMGGNYEKLWILILIAGLLPILALSLLCFLPIKDNYQKEFELLEEQMKPSEREGIERFEEVKSRNRKP